MELCDFPDADALMQALRQKGIPAFREFSAKQQPVPTCPCFVTFAADCTAFQEPVPAESGFALPVICKLRVRVHTNTAQDFRQYAERVQNVLLQTLASANRNVCEVQYGDIRYLQNLDRLSQEILIAVSGLVYCSQGVTNHAD